MKNNESFLTIDRSGSDCDHNSVTFDVDGKIVQLRVMGMEVLLSEIHMIPQHYDPYIVQIIFKKPSNIYNCNYAYIIASNDQPTPIIRLATPNPGSPMDLQILVDKILIDGYKTVLNKDEIKEFKELINTKIL